MRRFVPVLLLALAGCGGGSEAIFMLSPPVTASHPAGGAIIAVMPVVTPDYLDTTDIIVRSGENRLAILPHARWGERLSRGVARALAADLGARLIQFEVVDAEEGGSTGRQIFVTIDAFEVTPQGGVVLNARWHFGGGRAPGHAGIVVAAGGASDAAAIAANMARALDNLAARIAASFPVASP
jgi:uncharacterized lipoprotein YmbA